MTVALCVTAGLGDQLMLALPALADCYLTCINVPERVSATGQSLYPLDEETLLVQLLEAQQQGITTVVVVLMHALEWPVHELRVQAVAKKAGISTVVLSHQHSRGAWLERAWDSLGYATAVVGSKPPLEAVFDPEVFEQRWPVWLEHVCLSDDPQRPESATLQRLIQCLAPLPSTDLCQLFAATSVFVQRANCTLQRGYPEQNIRLERGDRLGLCSVYTPK